MVVGVGDGVVSIGGVTCVVVAVTVGVATSVAVGVGAVTAGNTVVVTVAVTFFVHVRVAVLSV